MALRDACYHPADLRGQVRSGASQKSPRGKTCRQRDLIPLFQELILILKDGYFLGDPLNKAEIIALCPKSHERRARQRLPELAHKVPAQYG